MTNLSPTAQRILTELKATLPPFAYRPGNLPSGTRVYGSRQAKPIRALEAAGLVTVTENQCWDGKRSAGHRGFKTYTVSIVSR